MLHSGTELSSIHVQNDVRGKNAGTIQGNGQVLIRMVMNTKALIGNYMLVPSSAMEVGFVSAGNDSSLVIQSKPGRSTTSREEVDIDLNLVVDASMDLAIGTWLNMGSVVRKELSAVTDMGSSSIYGIGMISGSITGMGQIGGSKEARGSVVGMGLGSDTGLIVVGPVAGTDQISVVRTDKGSVNVDPVDVGTDFVLFPKRKISGVSDVTQVNENNVPWAGEVQAVTTLMGSKRTIGAAGDS